MVASIEGAKRLKSRDEASVVVGFVSVSTEGHGVGAYESNTLFTISRFHEQAPIPSLNFGYQSIKLQTYMYLAELQMYLTLPPEQVALRTGTHTCSAVSRAAGLGKCLRNSPSFAPQALYVVEIMYLECR